MRLSVAVCMNTINESLTFPLFFSYLEQCKRLDGGLVKLKEAAVQLAELNIKLAEQKIVLTEKTAACEALLRDIKKNTEIGG